MGMHERRMLGFEKAFENAKNDISRARNLLSDVEILPSDIGMLIERQKSKYADIQGLAAELARKVPGWALELDMLIERQESGNPYVRDLAAELARKIPVAMLKTEALTKWRKSGTIYVRRLVAELNAKAYLIKHVRGEDAKILKLLAA